MQSVSFGALSKLKNTIIGVRFGRMSLCAVATPAEVCHKPVKHVFYKIIIIDKSQEQTMASPRQRIPLSDTWVDGWTGGRVLERRSDAARTTSSRICTLYLGVTLGPQYPFSRQERAESSPPHRSEVGAVGAEVRGVSGPNAIRWDTCNFEGYNVCVHAVNMTVGEIGIHSRAQSQYYER